MRHVEKSAAVIRLFDEMGEAALAVSGGVDSMTLAHLAARSAARVTMFHAVSPAVPSAATKRVEAHAKAHGWSLRIVGAGEFDDPDYLRNPLNRCYFCKSNLYGRLKAETNVTICSGANVDDLGDFRPGLGAAAEAGVRHPFVEADVSKADIRAISTELGLSDIAELPAQPCLASRVETGLAINADDLALIDEVEQMLAAAIGPQDIRCRITKSGVRIEGPALEDRHVGDLTAFLRSKGKELVEFGPYVRGSAFVGAKS
ncbi:MAG: adenine nucleotide alpha hydrolase [Pseudomonadota bacterium]